MALALISPADPVKFLQAVKTIAPQVGRLKIASGTGVSLAALEQLSGEAIRRRIERRLKKKTKRHDRDNSQVIKVDDAIKCVDKYLRNASFLRRIAEEITLTILAIGQNLVVPQDDLHGEFADAVAQCIREDALRQDTPRALIPRRDKFYHRPSRGHGHGRPGGWGR